MPRSVAACREAARNERRAASGAVDTTTRLSWRRRSTRSTTLRPSSGLIAAPSSAARRAISPVSRPANRQWSKSTLTHGVPVAREAWAAKASWNAFAPA